MSRALRLTTKQALDLQTRELAYTARRARVSQKPRQKYANQKVEVGGIKFDSKAEARYWTHLKLRLHAGEISSLRRQVVFELAPSVVIAGRKRPPLRYIADFVWDENGKTVVADVKGAEPAAYRIKRHLMMAVHDIEILEIRS